MSDWPIKTPGLPDGYEPPSASLTPPPRQNNGGLYTCGTCGSHTLIIGSTWDAVYGLYVWVLRCRNGHPLVPIPSNVYTINFSDEETS